MLVDFERSSKEKEKEEVVCEEVGREYNLKEYATLLISYMKLSKVKEALEVREN